MSVWVDLHLITYPTKWKVTLEKISTSINIMWEADPADIWLITKYNSRVSFLLGVNTSFAWVAPVKDKNEKQSPKRFRKYCST